MHRFTSPAWPQRIKDANPGFTMGDVAKVRALPVVCWQYH